MSEMLIRTWHHAISNDRGRGIETVVMNVAVIHFEMIMFKAFISHGKNAVGSGFRFALCANMVKSRITVLGKRH